MVSGEILRGEGLLLQEILGDKSPQEAELFPQTEEPFRVGLPTESPPGEEGKESTDTATWLADLIVALQTQLAELNEYFETPAPLLGSCE